MTTRPPDPYVLGPGTAFPSDPQGSPHPLSLPDSSARLAAVETATPQADLTRRETGE